MNMNYIASFFIKRVSTHYQPYLERLPLFCQKQLSKSFSIQDQELILDTLSKQSEERINLICTILDQQYDDTIIELCKKEVRLIRAFIKIDTQYLHESLNKPDLLYEKLIKK